MSIQQIIKEQNTTLFQVLEDSEVIALKSQLIQIRTNIDELSRIVDTHKYDIGNLKVQVNALESTITTIDNEVENQKTNINELKSLVVNLNQIIVGVETDIDGLKKQAIALEASISKVNSDFTNWLSYLTTKVDGNTASIDKVNSRMDTIDKQLAALDLDGLTKQVKTNTSGIAQNDKDIKNLTTDVVDLSNQIGNFKENDFLSLKTSYNTTSKLVKNMDSQLSALFIRLKGLLLNYVWFYNAYNGGLGQQDIYLATSILNPPTKPYIKVKAVDDGVDSVRTRVYNLLQDIKYTPVL